MAAAPETAAERDRLKALLSEALRSLEYMAGDSLADPESLIGRIGKAIQGEAEGGAK